MIDYGSRQIFPCHVPQFNLRRLPSHLRIENYWFPLRSGKEINNLDSSNYHHILSLFLYNFLLPSNIWKANTFFLVVEYELFSFELVFLCFFFFPWFLLFSNQWFCTLVFFYVCFSMPLPSKVHDTTSVPKIKMGCWKTVKHEHVTSKDKNCNLKKSNRKSVLPSQVVGIR